MRVKSNKYSASKSVIDHIKFDSKKEASHYRKLKLLERAGDIKDLECHPRYTFELNGVKIGSFTPDFRFKRLDPHTGHWELVIQDAKGMKKGNSWNWFRRQCKLLEAFYGLKVEVV